MQKKQYLILNLQAQLSLEMSLFVHFRDDRLQLRDLQDMPIPIPEEFQTWQARKMNSNLEIL